MICVGINGDRISKSINGDFIPTQNGLIGQINTDDIMIITFDFNFGYWQTNPEYLTGNEWTNVFHIGNEDSNRIGALFLENNKQLFHFVMDEIVVDNRFIDAKPFIDWGLSMNTWYQMVIVYEPYSAKIYIDGVLKSETNKAPHLKQNNRNVYISSPWWSSAQHNGMKIKDFIVESFPANYDLSQRIFNENINQAPFTLIGTIMIADEMIFEFDVTVNALFRGDNDGRVWVNVFHVGNWNYDRIPGVFIWKDHYFLMSCVSDLSHHDRCAYFPYFDVGVKARIKYHITQWELTIYRNNIKIHSFQKDMHIVNVFKRIWIGDNVFTFGTGEVVVGNIVIKTIYNKANDILQPCGISNDNLKTWYKSNEFMENGTISNIALWDDSDARNYISHDRVSGAIYKHSDLYIYGDTAAGMTFPYKLKPNQHTLIYLAKYNGPARQRILQAQNANYLIGYVHVCKGIFQNILN